MAPRRGLCHKSKSEKVPKFKEQELYKVQYSEICARFVQVDSAIGLDTKCITRMLHCLFATGISMVLPFILSNELSPLTLGSQLFCGEIKTNYRRL